MRLAVTVVLFLLTAATAAADARLAVAESHLTDYWTRTKSEGQARALFPKSARRVGASGCVAVAFSIDADGKAAAPRILNSFVSRQDGDEIRADFENSVMANVPHWRFAPANDKRQPVDTYATVTAVAETGLHSKAFQAEIASHCKVDNFSATAAAGLRQAAKDKS